MCKRDMMEFLRTVDKTPHQRKNLAEVGLDEICALANRLGYDFTLSDLKEGISAFSAWDNGKITDAQLSHLIGGVEVSPADRGIHAWLRR